MRLTDFTPEFEDFSPGDWALEEQKSKNKH